MLAFYRHLPAKVPICRAVEAGGRAKPMYMEAGLKAGLGLAPILVPFQDFEQELHHAGLVQGDVIFAGDLSLFPARRGRLEPAG